MVEFSANKMSEYVADHYKSVNKNRMHSTLLQNMGIDTWMTYELMEAAINTIKSVKTFPVKFEVEPTLRDIGSAKVASKLSLKDKDVDHFFSFHGIKIDSESHETFKHGNRPDGTFKLSFNDSLNSKENMVLFYEGDNHGKDDGKTNTERCKNAHKFYQYFAQSQSYNDKFSGCTIIAGISRATAGFIPFLDGMFQAHMLAFAVMVDYNFRREEKEKKETFLVKHLRLQDKVTYDFVIGINMGANSTSPWRSDFFDERIQLLKNLRNYTVNIIDDMKQPVDGVLLYEHTIMNVGMVFIAIPRAEENYLKNGPIKPCFLYPMHLAQVVQFSTKELTVPVGAFNKVLDINMTSAGTLNFRKHMIDIKRVLTAPHAKKSKPHDKDYCMLDNSDGFFYAALPMAYYTIQQLELVNDRLNYKYRNAKSFKKITEAYKDMAFENSKRKINVSMMSKNDKRVSLFCEICASISDSKDEIEPDLENFLKEGCLWESTDDYSPVVFFKTMRIFSLQGAMDFAFDIQTGQNEVYSKMLLSYPIGTQIVIKQCMKKLTENGTPAYFITEKEDEDPVSDIDDDEVKVDVTAIGSMIASIGTNQKTQWKFKLIDADPGLNPSNDDLAKLILKEYKKQVKWKAIKKAQSLITNEIPKELSDKIHNVIIYNVSKLEKLPLQLEEFEPNTVYEIQDNHNNYDISPVLPASVEDNFFNVNSEAIYKMAKAKLEENKELVAYTPWGKKFAQFTYITEESAIKLLNVLFSRGVSALNDTAKYLFRALSS
jgi:hypothetical protein